METLPALPRPLYEFVEIQVGQVSEGDRIWIYGLYRPDGRPRLLAPEDELLMTCATWEEAIKIGETIANRATLERMLLGRHGCAFTVKPQGED